MRRKRLLSEHTQVPVSRSAAAIQVELVAAGVRDIQLRYSEDRTLEGLRFTIPARVGKQHGGGEILMPCELPVRWRGVHRVLGGVTEERARRVAWRHVFYWVKAQVALIETEQAEAAEVFLPYVVMNDGGGTFYEQLRAGGFKPAALLEASR